MIDKIVTLLELNVPPRELASNDKQVIRRAIMGTWLPVSSAVLGLVVEHLPNPIEAQPVLNMASILMPGFHTIIISLTVLVTDTQAVALCERSRFHSLSRVPRTI